MLKMSLYNSPGNVALLSSSFSSLLRLILWEGRGFVKIEAYVLKYQSSGDRYVFFRDLEYGKEAKRN